MPFYYRLNKNNETIPCSIYEYSSIMKSDFEKERLIARTMFSDESYLSTVFLVFNHGREGEPVLFETMFFTPQTDEMCERYTTYKEAVAGHKKYREIYAKNLTIKDKICREDYIK